MYLIAFAVTYLLFTWQLRQRKIEVAKDMVLDMFFWAIIGLLVGARAFAVTIYDPSGYYLQHPCRSSCRSPWWTAGTASPAFAGMSYHGGFVGATIAIITFLKVKKLDALEWGDMLVAGIPLGYTFGRLGNFINAELRPHHARVLGHRVPESGELSGERALGEGLRRVGGHARAGDVPW